MIRRSVTLAIALALALPAAAEEGAEWLRQPQISPDGQRIVFRARGDLWVAPAAGGRAWRLTSHVGFECDPVWSPDGTRIAFASDRFGSFDVFVMSAEGGEAERLTWHSADDHPSAFLGEEVLFTSTRVDAPAATAAWVRLSELYAVPVSGGRPRQVLTTPAEAARPDAAGGRLLYVDSKGYENPWRKHHVSPVARDIWLTSLSDGAHTQLTTFGGEDREPQWLPGGEAFVWLSERSGSFNIWRRELSGGEPRALTTHTRHPVRSLSVSDAGALCYGWHGQVFIKASAEAESRPVAIELRADRRRNAVERLQLSDGATEATLSPNGLEAAFVLRGDVFVTSLEAGTTRAITETPEQERSVCWSKDGRGLIYAAERPKSWNILMTSIVDPAEETFFEATRLEESSLIATRAEEFQPRLSPNGQLLAYLYNRDELRVLDLVGGWQRTLVPADRNYSYSDGDIDFSWSPDSRWLAFTYLPSRRWVESVGIASVAGGPIVDVSLSGYSDHIPRWSRDGRLLMFASTRFGRRAHGSWGADQDLMALALNDDAMRWLELSEEELKLQRKREQKAKGRGGKGKGGEGKGGEDGASKADEESEGDGESKDGGEAKARDEPVAPLDIRLDAVDLRTVRRTLFSTDLGDYVVADEGEAILSWRRAGQAWDIWVSRPRSRMTRPLLTLGERRPGSLELSKDGKTLLILTSRGRMLAAEVGGALGDEGRPLKARPVGYRATFDRDRAAERSYLLGHIERQVRRKFYDPGLHGADWEALCDEYRAFLPSIETGHDLAELFSELLGELNASHTGSGFRHRQGLTPTAALGLLFDPAHRGLGLAIAEVLPGGPADRAGAALAPGVVITAIAGRRLSPDVNPNEVLDGLAGQRVRLELKQLDGSSAELVIEPVTVDEESELLYERWVRTRRALVERLSGGRLGYVHVRGMNDASFRTLYSEALGRHSDKEGLVVDTRFNGGGWLHEDLVRFLSGQTYLRPTPRGKAPGQLGAEPFNRWVRPFAVVMGEGNYSDAHIFPYAVKALKLAPLVGMPTAGTGTAVWWETLQDPQLYFGIPQVGMVDAEGRAIENQTLEPDVVVANDPASVARGEDAQLARAVEVVLAKVKAASKR